MSVGLGEYEHEAGECYKRKVATLDGPCGDPRCKRREVNRRGIRALVNIVKYTKKLRPHVINYEWLGYYCPIDEQFHKDGITNFCCITCGEEIR